MQVVFHAQLAGDGEHEGSGSSYGSIGFDLFHQFVRLGCVGLAERGTQAVDDANLIVRIVTEVAKEAGVEVYFEKENIWTLDSKGDDGGLAVDEDQAKIVRRIYREYLAGHSPKSIAAQLTKDGIPTPLGKKTWSVSTINSILRNEKYKGDALLQKTFTVDFLTKTTKRNEGEIPSTT